MFKNILVPTDLTDKSIKALEIAASMGKENPCRITLLHVVETIDDDEGEEEFHDFYHRLADRAGKKMTDLANKFGSDKIDIHTEIIYGKRVPEIVKYASLKDIDLIILSSHKIEDMESMDGWATISYRVGILAPCPVMMVK
ncbi:MAG: universal stress protein [Deltaproteobacteria bacterium]|nr:universal stress protein [Deltaproteobacteria bacterium]